MNDIRERERRNPSTVSLSRWEGMGAGGQVELALDRSMGSKTNTGE